MGTYRRARGDRLVPGLLLALAAAGGCSKGPGPISDAEAAGPDAAIPAIQGASHVSPLLGRRVRTAGVVTAVTGDGFYLQDPAGDGRVATSDAVFVARGREVRAASGGPVRVAPGDGVRVEGRVEEHVPGGRATGNLSVTWLVAAGVEVVSRGGKLPAPVVIGSAGRVPPAEAVIGPEELPVDLVDPAGAASAEFDPAAEGIDFYESLEAMRVRVAAPVAVSPTALYGEGRGEIFTLPEGGAHARPPDARTHRGGILLRTDAANHGDHNPERVQLQASPELTPGGIPSLAVGATLEDAVGVVSYAFGNYEVVATAPLVPAGPAPTPGEATGLVGTAGRVTVATYNVMNLNPLPETRRRLRRVARQIAGPMGAPDVVALQEIQDGNGTRGGEADTVTDATATLRALAEAVRAAGGPRYGFFDVAPAPNSTGGAPGGNIRNAYLFRRDRVDTVAVRSLTPAALEAAGARDPGAFGGGGRAPLAATFTFRGRRFTVVNVHFTSRAGSSPVFGAVQPFRQAGEAAREAQSRAVNDAVDAILAQDPGARILVAGDLNTFEFTDDLTRLLPGGPGADAVLENLILRVPPGRRYTYVFEGNAQAVDHLFATRSLAAGAEARVLHLNADLPSTRAASDHDPVVARMAVP